MCSNEGAKRPGVSEMGGEGGMGVASPACCFAASYAVKLGGATVTLGVALFPGEQDLVGFDRSGGKS